MMGSVKKSLAIGLVVLLFFGAGLSLYAGGSQEGSKRGLPVIRVAHPMVGADQFAEYFEPAAKKFSEEYQGAIIKFEGEQGDDLRTKLKTDIAAGNAPDIFWTWPGGNIVPYIKAGLLLDVREYCKVSKELKWDDIMPGNWRAYESPAGESGAVYGIPMGAIKIYMLANRELFQEYGLEYPRTLEDLKAVAKVFNANNIIPLAVGSKGGNTSHWLHAAFVSMYETEEYTRTLSKGGAKFTDPVIVKAAQLILDLAEAGVFPKDTMAISEYSPTMAVYNERRAAMIFGFPWTTNEFSPEIAKVSDMIHIPMPKDAKYDPANWTIGGVNDGYSVNAKTFNDPEKRQALIDTLDFMMSDEMWREWGRSGRSILKKGVELPKEGQPPLRAAAEDFNATKDINMHLWGLLPGAVSQETYCNQLDALWAQAVTAQQFAEEIQNAIDRERGAK
jgi:ABC-type glycerol-3-phosphate transport system substrate-binding protein